MLYNVFMAALEIALFGSFKACYNGQPLPGFRYDKVRALLAYLAVERDRPHRRDELVGLFWPDSAEEDARTSLRQALAQLRAAIGDSTVLASRESVQWNPDADADVDVITFEEALKAARVHAHRSAASCRFCARQLAQAVARYKGVFLAHFFLPGSAPFEDWAVLRREALQRQALEALSRLAGCHSRRGEYAQAEDCLRRLLAIEPWQEEAHRWLMRLLVLRDQRAAAVAQYEACRRQLSEALGVEPQAETTALYEAIRGGAAPGALQAGHLHLREGRKHNLPPAPTPFVGREKELGELNNLLDRPDQRLITLVGPGGVGKTRLALQVAADQVACFADGVFYVPLAAVTQADLLPVVLGTVLQVTLHGDADPRQEILEAVARKEMLLILDNLEHLPEAVEFVAKLLASAPKLVILATSRQRLMLRGEWVFPLEGLPVSRPGASLAEGDGSSADLFFQSAARLQPHFAPDRVQKAAIGQICWLVDGLPLAIELAAAWTPVLPCTEIAREIHGNLDFLADALSDLPDRHASIRAVFDHSWDLLSPEERAVFCKLSVFRGGFQREAAEQVAGAALPHLRALLDKSLVKRVPFDRYDMHELARQYACEQLVMAGEENGVREQASTYFRGLAERAASHIRGEDGPAWMHSLEEEMDNIRAVLEWSLASGQIEPGMRLAWAMFRIWYWHPKYVREGRRWLEALLAAAESRTGLSGDLVGNVLYETAAIAGMQHDFPSSEAYFARCLALRQSMGDKHGQAAALNGMAGNACEQGDITQARRLYETSLAIDRELGQVPDVQLLNLAGVAQIQGDYAKAIDCYEEALQIGREAHNLGRVAGGLVGLARVEQLTGERRQALSHYKESLRLFHELEDLEGMACLLDSMGTFFASAEPGEGDPHLAVQLFGAAEELRKSIEVPQSQVEADFISSYFDLARSLLGEEAFSAAWQEGNTVSIEELVQKLLQLPER